MKKIFVLLMAALVMLAIVSCEKATSNLVPDNGQEVIDPDDGTGDEDGDGEKPGGEEPGGEEPGGEEPGEVTPPIEEPVLSGNDFIPFKDQAFKDYLLGSYSFDYEVDGVTTNYTLNADTNGDGEISVNEASQVLALKLDVSENPGGISDISEIIYFTALEYLNCASSGVDTLDVRLNTNLKILDASVCGSLKKLILGQHPELTWMSTNNCLGLKGEIDFSGCPKLSYLCVTESSLSKVDLTNNSELATFQGQNLFSCSELLLRGTKLTSVDFDQHYVLKVLTLPTTLEYLKLHHVGLLSKDTRVDLTNLRNLLEVDITECYLTEFKLWGNTALQKLRLWSERNPSAKTTIPEVDLTGCNELTSVSFLSFNFGKVIFDEMSKLGRTVSYFSNCDIDELDMSKFNHNSNPYIGASVNVNYLKLGPAHTALNSPKCYIKKLDLTECTSAEFSCPDHNIDSLIVGSTQEKLICSNSSISLLDLSAATNLKELDCSTNYISNLDISKTNITTINCANNPDGGDPEKFGLLTVKVNSLQYNELGSVIQSQFPAQGEEGYISEVSVEY